MKRANGTGSVVKLSGKRRNPYAIRISERDRLGYLVQHTLSYHPSSHAAQEALDAYNAQRRAGTAASAGTLSVTLGEVYDLWSARKYAKAGQASVKSYMASWNRLAHLSEQRVRTITLDQLQRIIDEDEANGKSKSTINNDRALMHALLQFALERDIIAKDYSEFVQLPQVSAKHEKGAFTDPQMQQLIQLATSGTPFADTVLMLCYTGFRISEFLSLTPFSYDRAEDFLRGGMKTAAGRNRIIPVHPIIKPHLIHWLNKGGSTIICQEDGSQITAQQYRSRIFPPIATTIGAPQSTPHWCRHTFSSRLHAAGAPDLEHKRLMGHADSDITAHYTHTDIAQLSAAIRLLA